MNLSVMVRFIWIQSSQKEENNNEPFIKINNSLIYAFLLKRYPSIAIPQIDGYL